MQGTLLAYSYVYKHGQWRSAAPEKGWDIGNWEILESDLSTSWDSWEAILLCLSHFYMSSEQRNWELLFWTIFARMLVLQTALKDREKISICVKEQICFLTTIEKKKKKATSP